MQLAPLRQIPGSLFGHPVRIPLSRCPDLRLQPLELWENKSVFFEAARPRCYGNQRRLSLYLQADVETEAKQSEKEEKH